MQAPLIISHYPVIPELRVFDDVHGFAVLYDIAVFQYKCDNYYHPEADGVHFVNESRRHLAIRQSKQQTRNILIRKSTGPDDI